jgi:hypothetical protein
VPVIRLSRRVKAQCQKGIRPADDAMAWKTVRRPHGRKGSFLYLVSSYCLVVVVVITDECITRCNLDRALMTALICKYIYIADRVNFTRDQGSYLEASARSTC